MDIDLESFNHRKQRKISKEASKVTFSKKIQDIQNEFPQLSKEGQEFQKTRFSFYQQKILNFLHDKFKGPSY